MIHYSCDRCKRELDPEDDLRYVVKMEIYAEMEPLDCDELEDDRDHLLELHEILERSDDAESELIGDDIYQKKRYDLCSKCYKEFIKQPVGRQPAMQLDFSPN